MAGMAKVNTRQRGETPATQRGAKRRAALLHAARNVFLEKGYEGTSVEDVIARVGGSKASLYSYFGNKQGLFADMVRLLCDEFFESLNIPHSSDQDLEQLLLTFGRRALKQFTDPKRLAMLRVVMSESQRFPELAQLFYDSGPRRGLAMVSGLLRQAHEQGRIHCPDPEISAILFMEMIKAHAQWRSLLGLAPFAEGIDPDEYIKAAVQTFLRGCAKK